MANDLANDWLFGDAVPSGWCFHYDSICRIGVSAAKAYWKRIKSGEKSFQRKSIAKKKERCSKKTYSIG